MFDDKNQFFFLDTDFQILLGFLALSAVASAEETDLELLQESEVAESETDAETQADESSDESDSEEEDGEEEDIDENETRRVRRRRSSKIPKAVKVYSSSLKKELQRLSGRLTHRGIQRYLRKHRAFCNRERVRKGKTPALCNCKRGSKNAHCRRLRSVVCKTLPTHPVCEKPKIESCPIGSARDPRNNNRCTCFKPTLMVQGKCRCPESYSLTAEAVCVKACPANSVDATVNFPDRCECHVAYDWVSGECKLKQCPVYTKLNMNTGECDPSHKRCPPWSLKNWVPLAEKCQCLPTHIEVCRPGQECVCNLHSCPKGYKADPKGTHCEVDPCPGAFTKPVVRVVGGKKQTVCISTRTDCPPGSKKPFVDESKGELCECALASARIVNGKCVDKCKPDEMYEQQSGADGKCEPKYKKCPLYAKNHEVRFLQKCECVSGRVLTVHKSDQTEECECEAGKHDKDGRCEDDYKKCPEGSVKAKVFHTENCECQEGHYVRDNKCQKRPPPPCPSGQFRSLKHGYCTIKCPPHSQFKFATPELDEKCECHNRYESIGGKCVKRCGRNQRRIDGVCVNRCPAFSVSVWARVCKCDRGYFWSRGRCLEACPIGQVLINGKCHKHCGYHSLDSFVLPSETCQCEKGYVRKGERCEVIPTYGCPAGFFLQGKDCVRIMRECPENTVNWFVNRQLGEKCECEKGFVSRNKKCVPAPIICPKGFRLVRGKCYTRCPKYSRTRIVEQGKKCECQQGRVLSKSGRCVLPKCGEGEFRLKGVCSIRCPLFSKQMFLPSGAICQCEEGYLMQNSVCIPKPCGPGEKRVLGACVIECPDRSVHAYVASGGECECEEDLYLVKGKCVERPPVQCKAGQIRYNGVCSTRCPANSVAEYVTGNAECQCEEGYVAFEGGCAISPFNGRCRGYTLMRSGRCQFRCPYASQVEFVDKYEECQCKEGYVMKGIFPIQYCLRIRTFGCPVGFFMKNGTCIPLPPACPAGSFLKDGVCTADFMYCPSFSVKDKVNLKNGESCECKAGRTLEGHVCVRKSSSELSAAFNSTTTTTTTTTTLYKTTEERLSSMEQMHAWSQRAEQQGQVKLASTITEFAKLEVKLDQAQAVVATTINPVVKEKMQEKVQQLQAEQSTVASEVKLLRQESKTAASSMSPQKQSLDSWLSSVKSQAVQELALEIEDM